MTDAYWERVASIKSALRRRVCSLGRMEVLPGIHPPAAAPQFKSCKASNAASSQGIRHRNIPFPAASSSKSHIDVARHGGSLSFSTSGTSGIPPRCDPLKTGAALSAPSPSPRRSSRTVIVPSSCRTSASNTFPHCSAAGTASPISPLVRHAFSSAVSTRASRACWTM